MIVPIVRSQISLLVCLSMFSPVSGPTGLRGHRRSPPLGGPKLLRRPGQLTRGGCLRQSNRSVESGFRPDVCEGAWQHSSKRVARHSIRYGQNSSITLDSFETTVRGRPWLQTMGNSSATIESAPAGRVSPGLAWMPSARRLPHISTAEAGRLSTNSPRSRAANVRIGLHSTRRWRAARLHRASLVVSKVDRLTRSVAFLSRLLEAGVDAQFADLPQIDGATGRSLLQQMVAVAELEAGMISARTKAALAAAKKRGKKLGGNRGVKPTAKMRARSTAVLQQRADARAADIGPTVKALQAAGATSLRAIAAGLNEQGIPTARGVGKWSAVQVARVLERLQETDDS